MKIDNKSYYVCQILVLLSLSTLIGCYHSRIIEFIPYDDPETFENWYVDVYMKAYEGPSEAEWIEDTKFHVFISAKFSSKDHSGSAYKTSEYEAKITNIKMYFDESPLDKALEYEWKKGGYSDVHTFWSPTDMYIHVPININEIKIVAEVEFVLNGTTSATKEFVVQLRRNDETRLMFEGI